MTLHSLPRKQGMKCEASSVCSEPDVNVEYISPVLNALKMTALQLVLDLKNTHTHLMTGVEQCSFNDSTNLAWEEAAMKGFFKKKCRVRRNLMRLGFVYNWQE